MSKLLPRTWLLQQVFFLCVCSDTVFVYLQGVIINMYLQQSQLDVLTFPLIEDCALWNVYTTLSLKLS